MKPDQGRRMMNRGYYSSLAAVAAMGLLAAGPVVVVDDADSETPGDPAQPTAPPKPEEPMSRQQRRYLQRKGRIHLAQIKVGD